MDIFAAAKHIILFVTTLLAQIITVIPTDNQIATSSPIPSLQTVASPTPHPQSTPPNQTIETQQDIKDVKFITVSGEFSQLGQKVTYSITFPKSGGDVSGSFSGLCDGKVDGRFEGGDGGAVNGTANGSCNVSFLSSKVAVHYKGRIYLKRGLIDVDWEGDAPFWNTGAFTISFPPEE